MKWNKSLLLLIPLFLLLVGQIFAKLGAVKFLDEGQINWFLILSYTCLLFRGTVWIFIIRKFRLSYAYPLMSISYLLILIISYSLFGEIISRGEIIGALLIVSGIVLISIGEKKVAS